MRDSELAIGVAVLLGVVAALLYFLFPNQIGRLFHGSSHNEIRQSIETETKNFSEESKVIASYLKDSWTMKAYAFIDSALQRGDYPLWAEEIGAERKALVEETLRATERQGRNAERFSLLLESRRSLLDRVKNSKARMNTQAIEKEIATLQAQLESEKNALLYTLQQFQEKRRSLDQKTLRGWFSRSVFVSLLLSIAIAGVVSFITPARLSSSEKRPSTPPAFRLPWARPAPQAILLKPAEGPVLRDSSFHSTIRLKTGPVPKPISTSLKRLPMSRTAKALASILGGHLETPASHSHHSSHPGGLIIHTAKALEHAEPHLAMLPDPRIGAVAILAHDIGKILTLNSHGETRPHDIHSADILASLTELREEFDEVTRKSILLAIRHQHSNAEIPLNAPPLTHTILQFIKKADFSAAAEETRGAAERTKLLAPKIIAAFPFVIADLNVNGCEGGLPEGFLSNGVLYALKEPVKKRLLKQINAPDGPVFKGQDPVWNEMAGTLAEANLILKKIGAKDAGQKSCLFTVKTPSGHEKALAVPAGSIVEPLREKWLTGKSPAIEIL